MRIVAGWETGREFRSVDEVLEAYPECFSGSRRLEDMRRDVALVNSEGNYHEFVFVVPGPESGEQVVEVPQAYSRLLRECDGEELHKLAAYIGNRYGVPRWKRFDPRTDPGLGYGLIRVDSRRVCHASLENWDSGG